MFVFQSLKNYADGPGSNHRHDEPLRFWPQTADGGAHDGLMESQDHSKIMITVKLRTGDEALDGIHGEASLDPKIICDRV